MIFKDFLAFGCCLSLSWSFPLLNGSFLLVWCSSTCLFLLLLPLFLVPNPKSHCQTDVKELAASVFFHGCHGSRSYTGVFNPCWVHFSVCFKILVQFHSFARGCPVFPTPFIGDTILYLYPWLLCCNLIDHICVGLFLISLFWPIDLCVWFLWKYHTVLIAIVL